ncbi:MAG TPA: type VI secretion system membrane subunit TssM, partial [Sandaracinaceae bacterium]
STALRNSGLQFPYMSTSGGGVRGIGGTRNCDWWLTNEAVLLDTAGRWTTEEEDRDEWLSFLDLLKKYRPRKPLNGIIAAISLDQLGGAHDEEVGALARRMRERIDEVQNRLQMSLPVYVLFTKADLIPGFVEMFSDLSKQERGQIWGFTVPLAQPPADPAMHFAERFDELAAILERRALRRMGEERKLETRELVHGFPQQFATLRKSCGDFVAQLFEGSVFGETPMFRGVYFTSGTQEGRPIDRVMHKMAEAFGIRSEVHLGEPVTEAKSYFLRDVFLNVVFKDGDIAARSASEQKRQQRNQFIAAGAVLATALLFLVFPALAWSNNNRLLDDTKERIDALARVIDSEDVLTPQDLRPLRERVAELQEWDRRGAPFLYRWFMYRDEITDPVSRHYTELLREHVVGPVVREDLEAMDEFGRRYETLRNSTPTAAEHSDNYDRLRAHLLVTRPTDPTEPRLSENDDVREWVAGRITERWVERAGGPERVDEESMAEMREHADLYTSLLAREDGREVPAEESMRFPRDDETVERVRSALTRVRLSDMALDRLIGDVPRSYDLRLRNLVGTVDPMSATLPNVRCRQDDECDSGSCLNGRCEAYVRGAFTRAAWEDRVRDVLYGDAEDRLFGERWVLGPQFEVSQQTRADREEDLRVLRNDYFRAYVREWNDFLGNIDVQTPTQGDEDTLNQRTLVNLQNLTRGNPEPYRRLFQGVMHNVTLPMPEERGSETAQAASDSWWAALRRRIERLRGGRAALEMIDGMSRDRSAPSPGEQLGPEHVYVAFEGFVTFGAAPPQPAPAEGQPPPPPPALPLDTYEEQLHTVRDALHTHLDTPEGTAEALDTALQTARTTTRALIDNAEVGWRPRLLSLLWPPIEGSTANVARAQAAGAARSWCVEVYTPYSRNIAGGYPLDVGGHDIPLADFAAFYAPRTGTLWAFYDEVLDRRIRREGDQFVFATNLGQGAGNAYRTQLLQYLARAQDITSTFFPPGADGPMVQFDVRIRPSVRVATQEFCSGGQCYEYHNGPERWIRFTWPGENPVAGASIEIRGEGGIHERIEQSGEWGLFRLLEQGTVTSTSRGRRVFTMTWRLRDHQVDVSIDFRPVRGDAPFFGVAGRERNPPLLQPLRARDVDPPPEIANGRRICRVQ